MDQGCEYRSKAVRFVHTTRPKSRFSLTDRLSSVNKMFILWRKQEQFNLFNQCNWFVLTDSLLANSDKLNLILPKFACPVYFFCCHAFLHFHK